ncbi:hypothetical protein LZ30DRAFT_339583 [Colletotrichum cereale]|nr:hypothetical protein LZ30DRAFT_339583 [Colletotrichum cereale]
MLQPPSPTVLAALPRSAISLMTRACHGTCCRYANAHSGRPSQVAGLTVWRLSRSPRAPPAGLAWALPGCRYPYMANVFDSLAACFLRHIASENRNPNFAGLRRIPFHCMYP